MKSLSCTLLFQPLYYLAAELTCKLSFDEQVNIGQVKAGMVQGQLTGQALEKAYSILYTLYSILYTVYCVRELVHWFLVCKSYSLFLYMIPEKSR
jgi:hypothetical protein